MDRTAEAGPREAEAGDFRNLQDNYYIQSLTRDQMAAGNYSGPGGRLEPGWASSRRANIEGEVLAGAAAEDTQKLKTNKVNLHHDVSTVDPPGV